MKWEDFKRERHEKGQILNYAEQTNIECPECGKRVFRRTDVVLTSHPPQYGYFCECGWRGTA